MGAETGQTERQALGQASLKELVCGSELQTPGQQVDLSAPLSAADLHACLARISVQSDEIKDKVYRTVTAHHSEFLGIITHASETCSDVTALSQELQGALSLLDSDTPEEEGGAGAAKTAPGRSALAADDFPFQKRRESFQQSTRTSEQPETVLIDEIFRGVTRVKEISIELEEKRVAARVVGVIAEMHEMRSRVEHHMAQHEVVEAAEALGRLREALGLSARGEEDGRGGGGDLTAQLSVLKSLREECMARQSELEATLELLLSRALTLHTKQHMLQVTAAVPSGDRGEAGNRDVELSKVFDALEALGRLSTRLAKLADALFSAIIVPILRDPTTRIDLEEMARDCPQADVEGGEGFPGAATSPHEARLMWPPDRASKEADSTPAVVYPKVLAVVRFLRRHVLGGNRHRMQQLGRILWPRLADAIIAGCLGKVSLIVSLFLHQLLILLGPVSATCVK
eukprot:jgi/Mesen1/4593/ME000232S03849